MAGEPAVPQSEGGSAAESQTEEEAAEATAAAERAAHELLNEVRAAVLHPCSLPAEQTSGCVEPVLMLCRSTVTRSPCNIPSL